MILFPLALLSSPPALTIDISKPGAPISRSLYGIFFEEINQAGDGGLYAELLRNRGLETTDGPGSLPLGWSGSNVALDRAEGPNAAHPASLRIEDGGSVANEGFWGVPLTKGERYRLVVWSKGSGSLSAAAGSGSTSVGIPGESWTRIERTLTAGETDAKSRLTLSAKGGPVWVALASLFPEKTWKGRANGLRPDLASTVAAMKPSFVRFPGGCYVEGGDRFSDAFAWKRSVGPVEARQGVAHSMWGYPNTFGMGFHEYLQWCEDMGASPLFVVNCGIDHRQVAPMSEMGKWVDDAVSAIEYANGPLSSKWGALRAKNGHPKPFGLKYIEIGNENGGGFHGGNAAYEPRYRMVYDAIKAKYPDIVTIANTPLPKQPVETVDEHYYSSPNFFWKNADRYDTYDRKGPKVYVGEYAVTEGCGQGNLAAALGEAAFMTGLERNSDVVRMSSYAPLFVNVNNRQWNPNAIVFDGTRSYGTPSYYVQRMFSTNRAARNVAVSYPTLASQPPKPGGGIGLMTWATKSEFKDIMLSSGGKTIYTSAGATDASLADPEGEWSVKDGVISQSSLENNRTVRLKDAVAPESDYSLSLKARKLEGAEGFLITFDMNGGRQLRLNVGGWTNSLTGFERDGSIVGERVPVTVEANRWYDIRIEREGSKTRAYLEGKLVQTLQESGAPNLAAVVGVSEGGKEMIVKVVNGSDDPRTFRLGVGGAHLAGTGTALVLTGPDLLAENDFDAPDRIAPHQATITGLKEGSSYMFAPRSVTILRLALGG
jgi:alpha-L-arabinofuranosidase